MYNGDIVFILKKKKCGKMKLKFLKAKYGIEFKLPKNFEEKLKSTFPENSNLAVFTAVQFRDKLEDVIEKIEKLNYKTKISKAARTAIAGQILGCDSYKDTLNLNLNEIDGFVYIGDGYFHPNALLFAQENSEKKVPVLVVNIVQQIIEIITIKDIEKYIKKRRANYLKFLTSKNIGIYVTSKWGQEYKDAALKLKELYPEKNFYFFVSDNFNENEIINFPFVEVWVNTACPRIGQDDVLRIEKPIVNIKDIWK